MIQIKVVDPKTKQCCTLAGTGEAGDALGPEFDKSCFNEPGGICVGADEKFLYIADTNNHRVKILDLASKTVSLVRAVSLRYNLENVLNILSTCVSLIYPKSLCPRRDLIKG